MLYGTISDERWYEDDVTPKQVREDIEAIGDIDELRVYVNSPGGSVFAGHALHAILSRLKAKVTAYVDGVAASAASVVIMAADEVVMYPQSMIMIHDPWALAVGNADEMRRVADALDKMKESYIAAYRAKTGLEEDELSSMMSEETWFTAEEAVGKGFADRIDKAKQIAASMRGDKLVVNGQAFDISKYRKKPPVPEAADDPPKVAQPQSNNRSRHAPASLFERRLRVQQQLQRQKEMSAK